MAHTDDHRTDITRNKPKRTLARKVRRSVRQDIAAGREQDDLRALDRSYALSSYCPEWCDRWQW